MNFHDFITDLSLFQVINRRSSKFLPFLENASIQLLVRHYRSFKRPPPPRLEANWPLHLRAFNWVKNDQRFHFRRHTLRRKAVQTRRHIFSAKTIGKRGKKISKRSRSKLALDRGHQHRPFGLLRRIVAAY